MTPLASDARPEENLTCALGFPSIDFKRTRTDVAPPLARFVVGIGLVAVGMYRQDYWPSLTHAADGEWRAIRGTAAVIILRGDFHLWDAGRMARQRARGAAAWTAAVRFRV